MERNLEIISVNRWDPETENNFLWNKQKTDKVAGDGVKRSRALSSGVCF